MPSLQDRVVLVSGGTQGVGAGVARAAARAGATVVVTGRRTDVGERMERQLRELGTDDACSSRPTSQTSLRLRIRSAHGRAVRAHRLPRQRRRPDHPRDTARHDPGTVRCTRRRQPARPLLPHAGGRGGHAPPAKRRHDRQHHHHVRARRPALPRPVRRGEGRAHRAHAECGLRPPLGSHQDQRHQHRLDRDRGRGPDPARLSRRPGRLARLAASRCRWASSARSTRSQSSSSSCCPSGAAWSPARSSTGTRPGRRIRLTGARRPTTHLDVSRTSTVALEDQRAVGSSNGARGGCRSQRPSATPRARTFAIRRVRSWLTDEWRCHRVGSVHYARGGLVGSGPFA